MFCDRGDDNDDKVPLSTPRPVPRIVLDDRDDDDEEDGSVPPPGAPRPVSRILLDDGDDEAPPGASRPVSRIVLDDRDEEDDDDGAPLDAPRPKPRILLEDKDDDDAALGPGPVASTAADNQDSDKALPSAPRVRAGDDPVVRARTVHWAPELVATRAPTTTTAKMIVDDDDDDDGDDDDDLERAIDAAVAGSEAPKPKPAAKPRTRAKRAKPSPPATGAGAGTGAATSATTALDRACASVSAQRKTRAPRKAASKATPRARKPKAAKNKVTEDDIEQAMLETAEMALEKEEHKPMPNAPLPESTRKRTRQDADALADFYESIATGGERPKGTVNVLALAGGTKSGQILPHTAMFGPPLTVPATPATVPLGNSDVVHFMAEALLMANSRRTTGSSTTPRIEYRPRHISAHDMQNHYLVESVPRPSPVDPEVMLFPRPCALGENCTAFQIALPMTLAVVPHAKPSFALVGALTESEMREFYRTGLWPGEPVECILCMHFFPVLAASMLGKSTVRSPALCFQAMCSDTHPVHGFRPEALLQPSVASAVLELPMFNAITANLRRSVHVGVNFVDISHTMNKPVVFSNTARWTSDTQGADF